MRSPWGRVLKAIREDEDAVRSLGKNVYAYKMQSLIIGGVLGCLGGFIYALGQASIQPDIFGTDTTFFAYTVLILGGAARVAGPVVGCGDLLGGPLADRQHPQRGHRRGVHLERRSSAPPRSVSSASCSSACCSCC